MMGASAPESMMGRKAWVGDSSPQLSSGIQDGGMAEGATWGRARGFRKFLHNRVIDLRSQQVSGGDELERGKDQER